MKNVIPQIDKRLQSKIEIKQRGPLSKSQLYKVRAYLSKEAILVKEELEKVVYFESTSFPSIGDFTFGCARISLKVDTNGAYLRIKEGNPASPRRAKYQIRIKKSELVNLIYLLQRLGLKDGFYRPTFRQDFKLGKLVITIKTKCVMGDHFEIESPDDSEETRGVIEEFCKKLRLYFWTQEKYQQRITKLMKTAPAINVLTSDLFE